MNGRVVANLVLFAAAAMAGQDASAIEYARCAPTRAALFYDLGATTIRIETRIRQDERSCEPVARFNLQRPLSIEIHHADQVYSVPEDCLQKLRMDLDGVEAEPGGGYLRVWFGPSLDRAGDITRREEQEILVLFDEEELVHCGNPRDYQSDD